MIVKFCPTFEQQHQQQKQLENGFQSLSPFSLFCLIFFDANTIFAVASIRS